MCKQNMVSLCVNKLICGSSFYLLYLTSILLGFRGDYIHLERPMNNETLYAGDRAILRCRITGRPKPRYTWYKNDVRISVSDRRYKGFSIREYEWGSKLTIKKVETTDTGYYTCEADSRAGTLSTTGILYVRLGRYPGIENPILLPLSLIH